MMENDGFSEYDLGATGELGRVVVANDYRWIGDPRAAGFIVYVDGRRAGVGPLGDSLTIQVPSGEHVLRVRIWWFLSPRVKLDVRPGETRKFSADILRRLPVLLRIARGMINPFGSLTLEETGRS